MRVLSFCLLAALLALTTARADQGNGIDDQATPLRSGHMLTLKTAQGAVFRAYRSGPDGARAGILLVPGRSGLDAAARAWADGLAQAGYRVMVLDLYGSHRVEEHDALDLGFAPKPGLVDAECRAAIAMLRSPGRKLAVIGWGRAGTLALRASVCRPHEVSAVVLYDSPPPPPVVADHLLTPVLALYPRSRTPAMNADIAHFRHTMYLAHRRLEVAYFERDTDPPGQADPDYQGTMQASWPRLRGFLGYWLR